MIKLAFEGGINLFDVYDHSEYKQFIPMGKSLREFRKEAVISLVSEEKTKNMQTEIDGALEERQTSSSQDGSQCWTWTATRLSSARSTNNGNRRWSFPIILMTIQQHGSGRSLEKETFNGQK